MNVKLNRYLVKKFPKLYTECGEQEPFTLFGFECDDGWFRLILWLSRYLQAYIDQQNEYAKKYPDQYLPVKQIKVKQVKEKFATLRFYVEGGNERTDATITFAEYISGFICEFTGKTDNVGINKGGWIKTQNLDILPEGKTLDNYHLVDDVELRNILDELEQEKLNQN